MTDDEEGWDRFGRLLMSLVWRFPHDDRDESPRYNSVELSSQLQHLLAHQTAREELWPLGCDDGQWWNEVWPQMRPILVELQQALKRMKWKGLDGRPFAVDLGWWQKAVAAALDDRERVSLRNQLAESLRDEDG